MGHPRKNYSDEQLAAWYEAMIDYLKAGKGNTETACRELGIKYYDVYGYYKREKLPSPAQAAGVTSSAGKWKGSPEEVKDIPRVTLKPRPSFAKFVRESDTKDQITIELKSGAKIMVPHTSSESLAVILTALNRE